MTLNLAVPERSNLHPRILVFGIGGAGCNAVNNMISKELEGVDFVVANTDSQTLQHSKAKNSIQLGETQTEGLGAGAMPHVGAAAAEESIDKIVDALAGVHMVFITAGMGGGTGTGAAPIIARAARELNVLTVGVATKPFAFEGARRMRQAEQGIEELQKSVDTLLIIPNQNLFLVATEDTTVTDAFSMADDVLYQGVKGVTDLMVRPGSINLDFSDIRAVMGEMGKAMMGTGEASGEDRAVKAAEEAISNRLLDEMSLKGARGVLINIIGGSDLKLLEVEEAANHIREQADPDANIIFGTSNDEALEGCVRVSVVATGIDVSEDEAFEKMPTRAEVMAAEAVAEGTTAPADQEEKRAKPEAVRGATSASSDLRAMPIASTQSSFEPSSARGKEGPSSAVVKGASDTEGPPPPLYNPEPIYVARADESAVPRRVFLEEGVSDDAGIGGGLRLAASRRPFNDKPQAEKKKSGSGSGSGFGFGALISRMKGNLGDDEGSEIDSMMARADRTAQAIAAREHYAGPDISTNKNHDDGGNISLPAFMRRQAN